MHKRKLNVRLLRKIQKKILEEPLRIDMHFWAEKPLDIQDVYKRHTSKDLVPPCNTVGCIAGWALMLGGKSVAKIREYADNDKTEVHASKLLGIQPGSVFESRYDDEDMTESARLFLVKNWPEPFASQYEDIENQLPWGMQTLEDRELTFRKAKSLKLKLAKIVSKRIDHFVKTRE